MRRLFLLCFCGAFATSVALALEVEVQRFSADGPVPFGYQKVTDGIDATAVLDLRDDRYVDYLITRNSGNPGITAQKQAGAFLRASTVDQFNGANRLTHPDAWHVVFRWDDGEPLRFGRDFYGVTWHGWSETEAVTLQTRIHLATTGPVRVYHFFNDGWDYAHHTMLEAHQFTVTHHGADGSVRAVEARALTHGGAETWFGDHRQFYTAIIEATRIAEGDYLILAHEAANIGYKGTVVALGEDTGARGPGVFAAYALADGWVDTGDWLGPVYVARYPIVYVHRLQRFLFSPDNLAQPGWFYVFGDG